MFGRVVQLLRTMQALIGLPIITTADGEELGHVIDGLMDGNTVVGLLVKPHRLLAHHLFLPVEQIAQSGSSAVMVKNSTVLQAYSDRHKQLYPICTSRKKLKGKPVLSDEGELLGLAEDVYFEMELGTIIGYEVTDGWLADLKEGRQVIKGHDLIIKKERAILSL